MSADYLPSTLNWGSDASLDTLGLDDTIGDDNTEITDAIIIDVVVTTTSWKSNRLVDL